MQNSHREHSTRFYVIRAVLTAIAVVGLLLGLRMTGILKAPGDIPADLLAQAAGRPACVMDAAGPEHMKLADPS